MAPNLSHQEEEVAEIIATELVPLVNHYDADAPCDENAAPTSPKAATSNSSSMRSPKGPPQKPQRPDYPAELVDIEKEKLRIMERCLELDERRTVAQEKIAEVNTHLHKLKYTVILHKMRNLLVSTIFQALEANVHGGHSFTSLLNV